LFGLIQMIVKKGLQREDFRR